MMASFNQVGDSVHRVAREHGWWEDCFRSDIRDEDDCDTFDPTQRNFPESLSLMHSEISEALEEYRNGRRVDELYFEDKNGEKFSLIEVLDSYNDDLLTAAQHLKPCGIGVELVDCMIRILDNLRAYEVDIDLLMNLKRKYNEGRPYKHGGKRA